MIKRLIIFLIAVFITFPLFTATSFASSYEVMSVPVVSDNVYTRLGTVMMEFSAGQLQKGDVAVFRLPKDFKLCNADKTSMVNEDWKESVSNEVYSIGNDLNSIIIPKNFIGNDNALYGDSCPIEVTRLGDNEVKIKLIINPDPEKNSCMLLYLGCVYVDSGFSGDIELSINAPSNSGFHSGSITVGRVVNGMVDVAVVDKPIINRNNTSYSVRLRVEEEIAGSLKGLNDSLLLNLPNGFEWTGFGNLDIIWGDQSLEDIITDQDISNGGITWDKEQLKLDLPGFLSSRTTCFEIELKLKAVGNDISPGDVTVEVAGESNVIPTEITVAEYIPEQVIYFPDSNLEAVIRQAINKPSGNITNVDLSRLENLEAFDCNIRVCP